ncbi:hypothetical protein NN561_010016 [Cricetulus griseus]
MPAVAGLDGERCSGSTHPRRLPAEVSPSAAQYSARASGRSLRSERLGGGEWACGGRSPALPPVPGLSFPSPLVALGPSAWYLFTKHLMRGESWGKWTIAAGQARR